MYLLLFWIFFVPFDPFLHRVVAIDSVLILCCFVKDLLVVEFGLCIFLRISYKTC
jgi:hypothetical protein